MGLVSLRICGRLAIAGLMLLAIVGCGGAGPAATETITASVLVEASADNPQWFRDVEVPDGADGYDLLVAATDGQVEAEWYAEFRSHFVRSVLGSSSAGQEFWGVFLWNEQSASWEPLPYGADWFAVKDGHIMGWALIAYDPENVNLPQSTP